MRDRLRSEVSIHPGRPLVSVEFRGRGRSRRSVPFEPAHSMVAGFSLPKADAMRLAQAILIACSSDGAKKVSAVPLRGIERKRSLIGWKMVFDAAKEEGEDYLAVRSWPRSLRKSSL
jgi:hypothetical protein